MRTSRWVLVVCGALALACGGGGQSKITAACQAAWEPGKDFCTFTNAGTTPGSACVTVTLKNRTGSGQVQSAPVCSGNVAAASTTAPVKFMLIGDVQKACPKGVETSCDVQIKFQ